MESLIYFSTARENQDPVCLNYALSWLLYLRQAHPNQDTSSFRSLTGLAGGVSGRGENDAVASLKARAREGKHWSLLSSTLLEEAKGEMYEVSIPNPLVGSSDTFLDVRYRALAYMIAEGCWREGCGAHSSVEHVECSA